MAAPAAVSSGSNPRWGRSGEPGSAFNGLSRPGRGRGRGGGRGGRGGGRKPEDGARPTKPETSQSSAPVPANPSAPPAVSVPIAPPISDKPPPTPTPSSSSKPKPPARKVSRAIPPAVNTQSQTAEVVSAPSSAKPSGKRRRSTTAGKPPASLPLKINPPAPNTPLHPNRPRVGPIPNSAPIKDTPPHLNQRFDMRNDIDALVERVRAVAMDNRPSTPGSHIDWAGDDDDSLPDLNDWGVDTTTFGANKSEDMISPIIVGGLRPLPDLVPASIPNSPLKQVSPPTSEKQESVVQVAIPPPAKEIPPASDTRINEVVTRAHIVQPVDLDVETQASSAKQTTANALRKPLHPSLPAKPVNAAPATPLKQWAAATPMRNPAYPKTPISANKDNSTVNGPKPTPDMVAQTHSSAAAEETPEQSGVTIIVEQHAEGVQDPIQDAKIPTDLTIVEPTSSDSTSFDDLSAEGPASAPEYMRTAKESRISDDLVVAEGLAASIHAPQAMADSLSAPANMSSYSDSGDRRGHSPTHTRAHTVGRPPSFPKPSHNDYNQRFTRSGHSTPRGGFQNSYHSRTHSTPPTGAYGNQHRPHNRPVITGDAISRLARTIGRTNVPPTKQSLTSLGD